MRCSLFSLEDLQPTLQWILIPQFCDHVWVAVSLSQILFASFSTGHKLFNVFTEGPLNQTNGTMKPLIFTSSALRPPLSFGHILNYQKSFLHYFQPLLWDKMADRLGSLLLIETLVDSWTKSNADHSKTWNLRLLRFGTTSSCGHSVRYQKSSLHSSYNLFLSPPVICDQKIRSHVLHSTYSSGLAKCKDHKLRVGFSF